MIKGALISECGLYRYWLKRVWDPSKPKALFIMLNPSTADANIDDATIRKCIGFSERLGFGGFYVINLSAFRARDPLHLFSHLKLHGSELPQEELNALDTILEKAFKNEWTVILAHGKKGMNRSLGLRRKIMRRLLKQYDLKPKALRISDGVPLHPLMLPYTCKLEDYHE